MSVPRSWENSATGQDPGGLVDCVGIDVASLDVLEDSKRLRGRNGNKLAVEIGRLGGEKRKGKDGMRYQGDAEDGVAVNTRVFSTDAGSVIVLNIRFFFAARVPTKASHSTCPFCPSPLSELSVVSLISTTAAMQSPRPRAEVIFSSDVRNMDDWARRTRIPLTTADALGTTYARAHRWLQSLRGQLIREHNWSDASSHDPRMLFSLETSSIWRSSVGLPAGPQLKLQLPVHASSFFSPERRIQWQMVFHSDIFESVRKICPPINDILNLIQCLLTGVVTLAFEEHLPQGVYRTIRGLPPASWINENERALTDIFGISHFRALRRACSDTETAFKLEILPRH